MKIKVLFIVWISFSCLMMHSGCVSSVNDSLNRKLKGVEKTIPLPYHDTLAAKVRTLEQKRLPISAGTYDDLIESELLQRGMPIELKYLPYALSGFRPTYRKGDRCGYWALPSLVAMHYGLNIEPHRDERLSVEASTRAALDYLQDLHQQYGDWWMGILAFANSPNSMSQAMVRAKNTPQLWDYYEQHLLPDTEVIPDFISCVYLGNRNKLNFNLKDNELPDTDEHKEETVAQASATSNRDGEASASANPDSNTHLIKKGDNLTKIAAKYHVSINELMEWNHLENDKIIEGRTLIIKK